jgi:hypothetical protein
MTIERVATRCVDLHVIAPALTNAYVVLIDG